MASDARKHGCAGQKLKSEECMAGCVLMHSHALETETFLQNARPTVRFCTAVRTPTFCDLILFHGSLRGIMYLMFPNYL